jgi:hypothetical protein
MPDSCLCTRFNVRASILTYIASASTKRLVARQGSSAVAEFPLQTLACVVAVRIREVREKISDLAPDSASWW